MEGDTQIPATQVQETAVALVQNIKQVIIGKDDQIRLVVAALLAGGHVLLEDVPGTGKTMLAKALAKSVHCSFGRVQFTPDLLPSELTGLQVYSPKTGEFSFKEGALFAGIVLADEINRATPRTQSGLLESMEERQVTVDGVTRPLPQPFFVLATQNPVESQGTFPLPQAQLDRFIMRLHLGYPTEDEAVCVLQSHVGHTPLEDVEPVCTAEDVTRMITAVRQVYIHEEVLRYIVRLAQATHTQSVVQLGASTRAQIALARASQAVAAMQGRGFVIPDDVKLLMPWVMCHRLGMRTAEYGALQGRQAAQVVDEIMGTVEVPVENWGATP